MDIWLIYTRKVVAAAKGKGEKGFDYPQRRVPYLCERYRIRSVAEVLKILQEIVSFYNEYREHEET